MSPQTLALSDGAWAGLAVLGLVVVVALFVGMAMFARRVEEAGYARRFGWTEASGQYRSATPLGDGQWVPHQSFYMTKRRGEARESSWWTLYANCDTQVTGGGLGLRYRGRFRSGSEPAEHPILFFPWDALQVGIREDLKGDGRRGTVTTVGLVEMPHVALAFVDTDADRIAAASGGQWAITFSPPAS